MYRTRHGRTNVSSRGLLLFRLEIFRQRVHCLSSDRLFPAPINADRLATNPRRPRSNLFPFAKQMKQQILGISRLVQIQALVQITKSRDPWNVSASLTELFHAWTSPRWREIHLAIFPRYSLITRLITRRVFHFLLKRFQPSRLRRLFLSLLPRLSQRSKHISSVRLVLVETAITVKRGSIQLPVSHYARQFLRNFVALAVLSNHTVSLLADLVSLFLLLLVRLVSFTSFADHRGSLLVVRFPARSHGYGSQTLRQFDYLLG